MASTTPTPAPGQSQDASQSRPSSTSSPNKAPNTRPRPPHTQSAPVLSTNAPGAFNLSSNASAMSVASAPASTTERSAVARGYSAHLPYNPNRPPPHTYTRQHEFPPFPPLAQHPVLPFLTTAFTSTQESHSAPPQPARVRPALSSRANSGRQTHSMGISTIPTMDVSKNDPTAVFIRIPLVVPLVHNNDPSIDPSCLNGASIDGEPVPGTPLTYAILHAHRNWFLDADDFRKGEDKKWIDYPPELEPPRGWAPLAECAGAGAADRCKQAKEKKEKNNAVRTKGSYAHGEALIDTTVEYGPSDDCHEKTVLRCTFCRREYHGPNAKSMWRRHVFDKHKVAMKNRREGSAGMAPRLSSAQKKARAKAAGPSNSGYVELGPPVELSTPLTLDLNNEENLIRLLERVVSGNLDINLPASLLNSSGNGNAINLETIALALQKSGISLTVQADGTPTAISASRTDGNSALDDVLSHENKSQNIVKHATSEDQEMSPSQAGSSALMVDSDRNAPWDNPPNLVLLPFSSSDAQSLSQKRKADEARDTTLATSIFGRAPLKDNTVLDRNNHNQVARVTPSTPRRDKGKQKALPTTPGAPKLTQESFLSPSPSPRHPYTPVKPPAALRSRALATTGEESYLTLFVSSPAIASPGRGGSGRVSFTSPFNPRTSPMKRNDRDHPPTSDDGFGDFAASSPRYPFEFNIQGDQNSSSISSFESIPLELGNLGPAHWTPPSLGPSATVSKTTPRSLPRASSIKDNIEPGDRREAHIDGDEEIQLEYPEWSSPSDRARERRRSSVEDFDMDAYLDLEDAGPVSEPNLPLSPHKGLTSRGLQFSKEYGLLTPAEVERITASAHPGFEAEARSSKRRKVETS